MQECVFHKENFEKKNYFVPHTCSIVVDIQNLLQ